MSATLAVQIYYTDALLAQMRLWAMPDGQLWTEDNETRLVSIMGKFGTFAGDQYVLVNNEIYDDNPYYCLSMVLSAAFGRSDLDCFDVVLDINDEYSQTGIMDVDLEEVLVELDITLPQMDEPAGSYPHLN